MKRVIEGRVMSVSVSGSVGPFCGEDEVVLEGLCCVWEDGRRD